MTGRRSLQGGASANSIGGFGHSKEMESPDADLWARSRSGDKDAFGVIFERHSTAIYNFCFRRIGNWAEAEDLVAVVFYEAWRRRDKDLPDDKVLPWLYGIANNVVRNQRRSERRFAAALRRIPEPKPEPNFAERSAELLDDEHQMLRMIGLLAQLPRIEQEIFVLCAWMELSYEDAALALDVPVGTVRSRLFRARQRLRELDPAFGHREGRTASPGGALSHE